jgi:hypothetical protein
MTHSSKVHQRFPIWLIANNPLFTNPLPAAKRAISNGKIFKVRSLVGNNPYKWEILFWWRRIVIVLRITFDVKRSECNQIGK